MNAISIGLPIMVIMAFIVLGYAVASKNKAKKEADAFAALVAKNPSNYLVSQGGTIPDPVVDTPVVDQSTNG